jgi:uncharacterized protein YbjT (DUF2867 family)
MTIKNVIVIGGGGNLGPSITSALHSHGYNVSVLSRESSTSTFPDYITVHKTDYSPESLAKAFNGIDAVVSTIATAAVADQKSIVDAAVKAGVKRYIPSEYGCDTANADTIQLVPLFQGKAGVVAHLKETATSNPSFSWTAVITGPFFDWGLKVGFLGFDLQKKVARIWDDGNVRFSGTTLGDIGESVALILSHPSETANKFIYVASHTTSQSEVLKTLEKATGSTWEVTHLKREEQISEGQAKLAKKDFSGVGSLILGAIFGGEKYGSDFEAEGKLANKVLGLKERSLEADVKAVL